MLLIINNLVSDIDIKARLKSKVRCSKNVKQLNRVSMWISLGLGLVLGFALGLVPSSDLVL